jgi:hypothetical protein
MDGEKNENVWQTGGVAEQPPRGSGAGISNIPPSPEVRVRTLRSDLESMAQSGGGQPRFQTVKLQLPVEPAGKPAGQEEKASPFSIAIVIVIAAGIIAAVAFLAYRLFPSNSPSSNTNNYQPTSAQPVEPAPASSFVHHSFFKKPADQFLVLTVRSAAESASELQTYNQRFVELLSNANPTSSIIEIGAKGNNGSDLGVSEIFPLADIAVLETQFLLSHFSPDVTLFAYRDKNGFWPGYILSLQSSENWLFLKSEVAKLETSPKIANFFLSSPGSPASTGFKDDFINDQPARVLGFSAPGASFVYGWFRGYLILSTSEDGLKEAFSRL